MVRRLPKGQGLADSRDRRGNRRDDQLRPSRPAGHCTEYVFTDVSPRFTAHAQQKFAQYPFVQFRTLDIERDPLEQGFDPHSFDLIIASDVPACHAGPAQDARSGQAVARFRRHAGDRGTHASLARITTLIFGLLKGLVAVQDDDVRPDEPCLSQEQWKGLLHDAGFSDTVCVADCPDARHRPALGHPRARSAIAGLAGC